MDLSSLAEQDIVLQRYYHPETGEECVVALTEILRMIENGRTPDNIRERHPVLLDALLQMAKLASEGKSFLLEAWLDEVSNRRQNLRLMVDDSFPDEFVNFLQDQVGLAVKYSTLAGFPRPSKGKDLKRSYNRMARMTDSRSGNSDDAWGRPDLFLIRDRFGPEDGQNLSARLGKLAKLFNLSEAPRDETLPQPLVAILHWSDDSSEDQLTALMRKLSGYLPRILDDRATRMIYAGSDLGIYPPVTQERHLKIFKPKVMGV